MPILVKSDDIRSGRKSRFVMGSYGGHRSQWVKHFTTKKVHEAQGGGYSLYSAGMDDYHIRV